MPAPKDFAQRARRIVDMATGVIPIEPPPVEPAKDPAAVKRGQAGGAKGAKSRASSLTARERSEAARRAARARWGEKEEG
jgi:hypothetical protein